MRINRIVYIPDKLRCEAMENISKYGSEERSPQKEQGSSNNNSFAKILEGEVVKNSTNKETLKV